MVDDSEGIIKYLRLIQKVAQFDKQGQKTICDFDKLKKGD